jgi:hypothetical protein
LTIGGPEIRKSEEVDDAQYKIQEFRNDTKKHTEEVYNSHTPNTASNSSMGSGSSKKLGCLKSKLSTHSRVYKVNTSRSSNEFSNNQTYNSGSNFAVAGSDHQTVNADAHIFSKQQRMSNKVGNFGGPVFDNTNIAPKSRSLLPSFVQKFSSDTKINAPKEFILFGEEDEIEELEFSQNQHESESDDNHSNMENLVSYYVFEDSESPNQARANKNSEKMEKSKNAKEDEGSVSSNSEKDDE